MGTDANVAAWMATNEPFNRGDDGPLLDLLDEQVRWITPAGTLEGKAAAAQLIAEGRANGWREHRVMSISGHGRTVASTYVNVMSDGTEVPGGGSGVFNDDGRVVLITSIDEVTALGLPT